MSRFKDTIIVRFPD